MLIGNVFFNTKLDLLLVNLSYKNPSIVWIFAFIFKLGVVSFF